ncbi:MAG: tRNA epoxyqueuosine(34) reductase QueG [Magnetococcus sp. YQC-9]
MTKPDDDHQFNNTWESRKEALRAKALEMGFVMAGFAPLKPPPHADALQPWLSAGRHAEMSWMMRAPEKRADPARLVGDAGVLMVLGWFFLVEERANDRDSSRGLIACYARRSDYHTLLKEKAEQLANWLEEEIGQPIPHRSFVDTAPLLEKPLATAAGLGWQGKNTLLVTKGFGCQLMLAELYLPLPMAPDTTAPEAHCGSCDLCQKACPTGALDDDYRIDAGRCLAYLTVEKRNALPEEFRPALGNRIFGCDACITACPWNRFAPAPSDARSVPEERFSRALTEWAGFDEPTFRNCFAGTPVERLGLSRFLRNVATALGNWQHPDALAPLRELMQHPSPLVREHAARALESHPNKTD